MAKDTDYFDNDTPEHLKEILQTKGVHRDILEVRNLKAVTELCIKTTKSLKYQTFTNVLCITFGALFSFFLTNYYSKDNETVLKDVSNLKDEKNEIKNDFKTYRNETNKQLFELKKQLDKLKK
jgi:hypothetical protein